MYPEKGTVIDEADAATEVELAPPIATDVVAESCSTKAGYPLPAPSPNAT